MAFNTTQPFCRTRSITLFFLLFLLIQAAWGQTKDDLVKRAAALRATAVEQQNKLKSLGPLLSDLQGRTNSIVTEATALEGEITNTGATETVKLTEAKKKLDDIEKRINDVNSDLLTLRNTLLHDEEKDRGSVQIEELFMTYRRGNNRPGNAYFDGTAKRDKFYKDWHIMPLAVYLEKGRFVVDVNCADIMNMGLCIPASARYKALELTSALKTVLPDANGRFSSELNKELDSLIKGNAGKKGTIFIDLYKVLMQAYGEAPAPQPVCCPDEPKQDSVVATQNKLCHALELPDGISVTLVDGIRKKFIIRSAEGRSGPNGLPKVKSRDADPRQYMTVYERKRRTSAPEPIWWLVKKADTLRRDLTKPQNLRYPDGFAKYFDVKQKYDYIDSHSTLEIHFDKEALAGNVDFYGNMSFTANIRDGRAIEVTPYYVIGQQKRSLGINADPVRKVANNFLRLFIEAKRAEAQFSRLQGSILFRGLADSAAVKANLRERVAFIKEYYGSILEKFRVPRSYTENTQLYPHIPAHIRSNIETILYFLTSPTLYNFSQNPDHYTFGLIDDELDRLTAELKKRATVFRSNTQDFQTQRTQASRYETFLRTVKEIKSYLDYFNSAGDDSRRAFLGLSSISEVKFAQLSLTLASDQQLLPDTWGGFMALSNDMKNAALARLMQINDEIKSLDGFSGDLAEILRKHGYSTNFLNIDLAQEGQRQAAAWYNSEARTKAREERSKDPRSSRAGDVDAFVQDTVRNFYSAENLDYLLSDDRYSLLYDYTIYKKIRDELAQKAGIEIFDKLVYATIDLDKSDIPEGAVLEINLMWYNTESALTTRQTADQGTEMITLVFTVKKNGWYFDFAESAMFIDRINENLARQAATTPSRFKPAAGVSMLWSYHNDHRGATGFQRVVRGIQPSFGINVSVLDFSPDETLEVGLAPTIGLFQNRLFVLGGYNFMARGEAPFFMGFGVSFLNMFSSSASKNDKRDDEK